ncbi:MAG: hypothetical protein KJO54_09045 [Gammaproteobacteria bacterium]|nr:hypothetical protein [Gammaproteobacteria bacterium]NNF61171.1 hypothetical protein [Gammaproteobacteria bacterium]NNM19866.1 hypothetical protein [Gammaproteobacteria bacterium]
MPNLHLLRHAAALAVLFASTASAQGLQLGHPLMFFNAEGVTYYSSAAFEFNVQSIPLAVQPAPGATPQPVPRPAELNLNIRIDEFGTLLGGTPGPDLQVRDATGVLLEAEISRFTVVNSSGPTDIYDLLFTVTGGSMAGSYSGAELGMNLVSENSTFDGTFFKDFSGKAKGTLGRVGGASDCNLTLDKQCLVVSAASNNLACESKIAAARFRYIGPGFDGVSDITITGASGASASYSAELATNETVLAGQNGYSIDAALSGEDDLGSRTTITIDGVAEELHTSCSTPFVAGQPAPLNDPKGDPSPNWLVEAFIDKEGNVVGLPDPEFADSCEIPAAGEAACDDRPTQIQFSYTGAACPDSDNDQPSDKFECTDLDDADGPVSVTIYKGSNVYANINDVMPGDLIEASAAAAGRDEFDSEVEIEIRDPSGMLLQHIRLHTSCSQPLAIGDSFGAMTVAGFTNDEQGTVRGGIEVLYRYIVDNPGPGLATDITVTDTSLEPPTVPGSPIASLAPGMSAILEAMTIINGPVSGTATLVANVDGLRCEAFDTAPITVAMPPPCQVSPDGFELKDDALKWDISNTGADFATIESIEVSWPNEFGALREVKLEGDKIFEEQLAPPAATIDSFSGKLKDRQIEAGKTSTLEIKFKEKYKQAQPDDIAITVTFAEGCSISFEPGSNPFGDCDGKLRELTMIWDGMVEPVNIRAYAGDPGSDLVYTSGDLFIGNEVTAGDFTAADAPNDVHWEIFDSAGNLIGESKFHRSCSDDEMDGPEDCGLPQGNGKGNDAGFVNDWLLEGLRDDNNALDCSEL